MNKLHAFCSTLLSFAVILSGCAAPNPTATLAPLLTLQPTQTAQPTQTPAVTGTPILPSEMRPCPSGMVVRESQAMPTPLLTPASTPTQVSSADTEPLKIVGQIGGPTRAIAVAGNYAYVGVGLRLVVLDISIPNAPREVGSSVPIGSSVEDVSVVNDTAFVAAGGAGLYAIDISNPVCPTPIGNYDTPGYAEGVTIAGKYAYIADGPGGLRIVNIADPAKPTEVSAIYSLNYIFDIVVKESHVYMAAAGAGLLVADVSDPVHPAEVSNYDTPGYAYGITASGFTVYIADGWEGLQVLDVSNPTQLKSIGAYDTPGWAMDVAIAGDMLYLADASGGLRVLNISDKLNITETGSFRAPDGHSAHLAISDDTVYVADIRLGVHIVDVSAPSEPRRVGLYSPMGYAQAVAIANGYAYVAAQNYGFRVIDLEDLTHPREVATFAADLPPKTVVVSGTSVYLGTDFDKKSKQPPNLYAVDVSDPLHPKTSPPQPLTGNTRNMFIQGKILYNAAEFGLALLDISDPLAPHEIGFLQTTEDLALGGPTAVSVTVAGNVAYLAVSGAGLYTINISNPKQPVLLGTFNEPPSGLKNPNERFLSDVAVAPPFAYILDSGMVRALDISDPKHPKGLGSFPVPLPTFSNGGGVRSLAIDGNKLFIADSAAGLLELDVTDPAHPKLISQLRLPGLASWVSVDKGFVYVADGEGGLFIIQPAQESSAINSVPVVHQGWLGNAQYNIPSSEIFSQTTSLMPIPNEITIPDQSTAGQYQPVSFLRPASPINVSAMPQSSTANTCTVTSAEDSGPDTLRGCLQRTQIGETITFDSQVFPPKNPATIYITDTLNMGGEGGVTIDASHAGVILDGSRASKGTYGLNILSNNNVIKGLQILNFPFPGGGIALSGEHNIIGGDRSRGEAPLGEGNVIGDIAMKLASGNLIIGNYIGIDVSGRNRLGKPGYSSIGIEGTSSNNRIEGNVIAGSVSIGDQGSSYNEVVGNYIGTDASGTVPLGDDAVVGVGLPFNRIGGTQPGEGNVINGRIVVLGTSDVIVIGNLIGIDSTGKKAFPLSTWMTSLGNGAYHNFIGGTTDAERNVIAGGKDSVLISLGSIADYNFIAGNYLGTDASGGVVFPNFAGISLEMAEHNAIQGNLISGSQAAGVSLSSLDPNQTSANFNWVRANRITKNKVGLAIGNGEGNKIVDNSFIGNGVNAQDRDHNNRWDDGTKGNYWSDYNGEDKNGDGIGDTPFSVSPNGIDNYPLIKPP